jgi:RNA polymerase sigma-70 factor (ECF subfamily)
MSDEEIIGLILRGDKDKFRVLVERYRQMVFRTCMGFVHDKDDADDLSQEIFIQVYQSLSRFKGNAAFSTWLYRITVNASLNRVRKTTRNTLIQRIEGFFGGDYQADVQLLSNDTDNPEDLMIKQEHIEWVRKALDSLPVNQRTAIVLSRYDDLPQKEIAQIMNITEGAVEALLQRAKRNLREKLTGKRKNIKK